MEDNHLNELKRKLENRLKKNKKSDLIELGRSLNIFNLNEKHTKEEWINSILSKYKYK